MTYYHVELAGHGLVVSEGAVTESYLDDGNRHLFDNAKVAALVVDFEARRGNGRYAAAACAPVLAEGDAALDVIRARLAARAEAPRQAKAGAVAARRVALVRHRIKLKVLPPAAALIRAGRTLHAWREVATRRCCPAGRARRPFSTIHGFLHFRCGPRMAPGAQPWRV